MLLSEIEENSHKRENCTYQCTQDEGFDVDERKLVGREILKPEIFSQAADQRREPNTSPNLCP
jgi:hypothetical protein